MHRRIYEVGMLAVVLPLLAASPASADQDAAAKRESVTIFGEAKMSIPAKFKRVQPKSSIVSDEFQASKGDATARVTMMRAGGGADANIKRWEGQFTGGDQDARKTEQMKLGKWDVYIVDINGNYAERVGGGPVFARKTVNRENYAMTGAIVIHPDGPEFYIKMIGPEEVVKANRKAFVEMIKGIQQ